MVVEIYRQCTTVKVTWNYANLKREEIHVQLKCFQGFNGTAVIFLIDWNSFKGRFLFPLGPLEPRSTVETEEKASYIVALLTKDIMAMKEFYEKNHQSD